MYLLDTNVVSEPRKPRPHGAVLAWLHAYNVLPTDAAVFRHRARLMHKATR